MTRRPKSQIPFVGRGSGHGNSFGDEDVRIAFDELSRIKKEKRAKEIGDPILYEKTIEVKQQVTAIRRKEFNIKRNQLLLSMIDSGHRYVCANEDCGVMECLHIDHIVPLSKGGSDDVDNLQFLCKAHNSEKGAKI